MDKPYNPDEICINLIIFMIHYAHMEKKPLKNQQEHKHESTTT